MKCPKCGNYAVRDPYVLHNPGFTKRYCTGYDPTKPKQRCKTKGSSTPRREHLDITCGECGYSWWEPCADGKEATA